MSPQKKVTYKARPGAPIDDEKAAIIGNELEQMIAEGIPTTPENLVERAKRSKGDLHQLWNWDVNAAAQAHWTSWARRLIASVVVLELKMKQPAKAFFSVSVKQEDSELTQRRYMPRRMVLLDMNDELVQVSDRSYKAIMAEIEKIVGLQLHRKDSGWADIVSFLQIHAPTLAPVEVE